MTTIRSSWPTLPEAAAKWVPGEYTFCSRAKYGNTWNICFYVCIYIYIYVHSCKWDAYIYIYIHIYIYTYIHAYGLTMVQQYQHRCWGCGKPLLSTKNSRIAGLMVSTQVPFDQGCGASEWSHSCWKWHIHWWFTSSKCWLSIAFDMFTRG